MDKLVEMTSKSSEISNIKNNIRQFRETLEEMEVIKKAKEEGKIQSNTATCNKKDN
jgi:hypothetical protein